MVLAIVTGASFLLLALYIYVSLAIESESGINSFYQLLFFVTKGFIGIAYCFIGYNVLSMKSGDVLSTSIGIWAILLLTDILIGNFFLVHYYFPVGLMNLIRQIPYPALLLFGLAAYCRMKKESLDTKKIPKLWFVPGILATLLFADKFYLMYRYAQNQLVSQGLYGDEAMSFFVWSDFWLNTVFYGFMVVTTVFLLGYWIIYTYSLIGHVEREYQLKKL